MNNKYKIVISNRNLYREVELPIDAKTYRVGTSIDCDFRLHKELFFEEIKLDFSNNNGNWAVMSSDNTYITIGDTRRLLTTELKHGDVIIIKYQESNSEVFSIEFKVDFESKKTDFERKIDIGDINRVSIGASNDNNISLHSEYIINDKIELIRNNADLVLEIKDATYGVYHNGNKADNREVIKNGDFFSISDFIFYYKDNSLWTEISDRYTINNLTFSDYRLHNNYPKFCRNTRLKYSLPCDNISILVPTAPPKRPQQNLALTLLPALAMLALTIVVRGFMSNSSNSSFIIFSVCSMAMGIITSIASFFSARRKFKTDCAERISQYRSYIDKKKREIEDKRNEEKAILEDIYYDTQQDLNTINKFEAKLFDRMNGDSDFLHIYIGKGKVEAKRKIDYKQPEAFESDDVLNNIPLEVTERYKYIDNCPVTLDLLKSNAIGIVGTSKANYDFAKNIVIDIVARHYLGEVKLCILMDEPDRYVWAKYLPHVINPMGIRNFVYDLETRNNIFEYLYKELTNRSIEKDCSGLEYIVIIIMKEWGLKSHPLSQFIERATDLNITFLFFEECREQIPLYCDQFVFLSEDNQGVLCDVKNSNIKTEFNYDTVSDEHMLETCKVLAPVYCDEISLESSLRKNITLFELLNIYSVDDLDLDTRWQNSQIYNSMAVPLGVNSKDEVVYLNLHEKAHGPHGLVAGTTGSGKSEILQTYILSAATLFHPYEISFVIIDFKGGGMVNQFKNLPHLVGAITNIDGREIDRSLKSIKAELLKRQELFAEANVNHIDKYIRLYKEHKVDIALPHLVIIVDEFAELKAEQPEFMKELISAARIGRSLGVHLILATQKPSGQVNEQIWSNSKFKLCLKVQNKEDSNEVLKSPLAAEIKEPGRAYLQVGNNEIFELLQSGFSGAEEKTEDAKVKEFVISQVEFNGKRKALYAKKVEKNNAGNKTQLEAVVQYVKHYCDSTNIWKLPNICMPPLENIINISRSTQNYEQSSIPIGIYDDPNSQYQGEAKLDFSNENTMIIGSSATGKTNLLQTVIRQIASRFSPKEANIYIMDFGAMYLKNFERLNHVGGIVTISDEEKLRNLFKLLLGEMQIRKAKFLEYGISSFASYIEGGYDDFPQIYLIIDNFTAFKEVYSDAYEDDFVYITREGLACGISVIVSNSQTSGLGYKYMSNFACRIALHCNDSTEYSSLFDRCRIQPKDIPGRALCRMNKELYEMQTFLAFEGEKEIQRSEAIKKFIELVNSRFESWKARPIPEIPESLNYNYIESNFNFRKEIYKYPIGLDYSTVDVVTIDFNKTNEFCIVGNELNMRMYALNSILKSIEENILVESVKLYIVDNIQRTLKEKEKMIFVDKYTIDYSIIGEIIAEIELEMAHRYEILMNEGIEAIENMQLYLVIINNKDAIDYISANKNILETYNKIIKQYKSLGICFIYSDIEDTPVPYNASELMKRFKENKKAMITTQNLKDVKFCEIPSSLIRNMKALGSGDVYLLNGSDVQRIKVLEVK